MTVTESIAAALSDRYEIERLIGEGGMATVYLARDVRHNRRVALKVLRPDLGAVVGVERFLAEIQVTANLQHPNLLPLFDSGTAGDQLFYVMPYVPGESLRARLDREKQLPVDEAIRLATAIGGALDYAHRQGVIHRDLKPENVLLQEGQPLVADFGIALAVSNAGGTRITQTGLSLGTPHYMSPEQATGDRAIDGRTDIYSLGALTYEMLTGDPPHVGSTSQAIIARVLTERPRSIRASRPNVPEQVEAAVERALEKLPADRWATAREFVEGLTGARPVTRSAMSATAAIPNAIATPGMKSVRRPSIREAMAWVVAIAGVTAAVWVAPRPAAIAPVTRLAVELSDSIAANGAEILAQPSVAVSPNGTMLAFIGTRRRTGPGIASGSNRRLMVRRMDDVELRVLESTQGASLPLFSPDGEWIAFLDGDRNLRKVPVTGGTPQLLADSVYSASWSDDGNIYFTRLADFAIWSVSAQGGRPVLRVKPDSTAGIELFGQIDVIPGGGMALVRIRGTDTSYSIGAVDLRSGRVHDWRLPGSSPRFVSPGFVVYQSGARVLSAIRFSPRKASSIGTPIRIAEDVEGLGNGGLDFGVSQTGTIAFRWARGVNIDPTTLARLDRNGKMIPIRLAAQRYDQPRVSADGRHVVVRVGGTAFNAGDLWMLELASGALSRLTTGNSNYRASWSRDGKRVNYITGNPLTSTVRSKSWDGSGTDSTLLDRPDVAEFAEGPPGGWSAIRTYGQREIYIVPSDSLSTATPRPFVIAPSNETDIALSPSGRLLAYQSDETGRYEVYVRPVPGPGPRVPVSIDGGTSAVWSRDGGTLYYRNGDQFLSATIVEQPSLAVTRRDPLFEGNVATDGVNLAVMPGGGFVAAIGSDARTVSPYHIAVLSNWESLFAKAGDATRR